MTPFRTPTAAKERISVLAERLILAMAAAKLELPAEASLEALWTLGIAVAGWWLKSRSAEVASELKPYAALPFLFGLLNGVQSLPTFVAAAANAMDDGQLAEGGPHFAEVVSELGVGKLKAALSSSFFARLQMQIVADFPAPVDLADSLRPQSRSVPKPKLMAAADRPAAGRSVVAAVAVPLRPERPRFTVSEETAAFVRARYPEEVAKQILKG